MSAYQQYDQRVQRLPSNEQYAQHHYHVAQVPSPQPQGHYSPGAYHEYPHSYQRYEHAPAPTGRRPSGNQGHHERQKKQHRHRGESNPFKTTWRKTSEFWDVVLVGVGRAWFKMGGR